MFIATSVIGEVETVNVWSVRSQHLPAMEHLLLESSIWDSVPRGETAEKFGPDDIPLQPGQQSSAQQHGSPLPRNAEIVIAKMNPAVDR